MKTLLVTVSLAMAGVTTTQAQVFRPSVGSGAVVGAVAGGLIGGHNGDRWAEGAVIGAAAGALLGAAMTPQQPAYTPPPVYQTSAPVYGQQVYTTTIPNAPVVPNAPVIVDQNGNQVVQAQPQVVQVAPQVVQAPPQVVYVERQPQVVYVPAPAPVVYARPPVISFGIGVHSGPRYYPSYRSGYYRGPVYHHGHHGHRGHGHRR